MCKQMEECGLMTRKKKNILHLSILATFIKEKGYPSSCKIVMGIGEKEEEGINNLMAKIQESFTKLENLEAENAYLNEIGIAYVKCLKEFDELTSTTTNYDTAKLATLLTLHKIELPKYNGDVMYYHTFILTLY